MTATLELEGLSKRFGGLTATDNVSLSVPAGSLHALIGPNGAGKTTVFNLMAGAIKADHGRIELLGTDVTSDTVTQRCESGLSRTFQNPRPFKGLSVLQNVMVGGMCNGKRIAESRERAEAALRDAGLWSRRDNAAGALPLGQQKKLEIARCLATDPRVLLLDEVTGGLSPNETDELIDLTVGLRERGITIIMIEHNMRVALTICERIVVLNFGKVIAEGDGRTVASHPEVVKAYLGDPDLADFSFEPDEANGGAVDA
jgi:ABC-type branched-subunit amino acid transport system ATPase component